jgi:hypothetical protein
LVSCVRERATGDWRQTAWQRLPVRSSVHKTGETFFSAPRKTGRPSAYYQVLIRHSRLRARMDIYRRLLARRHADVLTSASGWPASVLNAPSFSCAVPPAASSSRSHGGSLSPVRGYAPWHVHLEQRPKRRMLFFGNCAEFYP